MRAIAIVAALGAIALLLGTAAEGAAPKPKPKAKAKPQRMQVTEDEWTVTFSRLRLRPGLALVEVFNIGQDAHNLVIRKNKKGAKPVTVKKLDHFERKTVKLKLTKGTYTFWCSLPRHKQRGMWATLRVR